jgi:hypothetical protein
MPTSTCSVFADGLIYLMSIGRRRRVGNVVPRWCHVGICHREYYTRDSTNISIVKLNLLYTILEVIYESDPDAAEMDQPHACRVTGVFCRRENTCRGTTSQSPETDMLDKVKWKCRLPAADAEKYFRMTNKTAIKASLPLRPCAHHLTILGVSKSL